MAAITAQKKRFGFNANKLNLFLDIGLAAAFVLVLETKFTGQNLHELIGVGIGAAILIHLVLHWRWIVSITKTFFRQIFHESRFNYLLNIALFVDMLVIVVTGIAISRTLGLSLGIDQSLLRTLEQLHKQASSFSLMIVGLHVAIHWKWIVAHAQKYLFHLPKFHLPIRRAAKPMAVNVSRTQNPVGGQS